MNISLADVEAILKDAFAETLKARFEMVSKNAVTATAHEVEQECVNVMSNLRKTHERMTAAAAQIFS